MQLSNFKCDYCGKPGFKKLGDLNRALKSRSGKVYCNQKCFGLDKRTDLSTKEQKEKKRLYDIEYRKKNSSKIKKRKAEYFQKTYDPEKAAIERKKRMPYHVEYCRQPEYKAKKHEYDIPHRYKKIYGEFWECMMLVRDIHREVIKLVPDKYERLKMRGLLKRIRDRKQLRKLELLEY
jgi:hypothetical protein